MTRRPGRAGGPSARDRRWRRPAGTMAAYAAALAAFAYAAVSLYWTTGGTLLLGTLGGTMEDIARDGGLPAVALGLTATVLKGRRHPGPVPGPPLGPCCPAQVAAHSRGHR